jgi:peroxiredoxin
MMRAGRIVAVGFAVVALLAVSACSSKSAASTGDAGASTKLYAAGSRSAAPAVSGSLLGGGTFDLSAQRGHVVVVNFWESYCAPCRVEAADLESLSQTSGAVFIGVNVNDDQDKASAYVEAHKITYPSIFDPGGRVMLAFRDVPMTSVPSTIVIDPDGKVAAIHLDSVSSAELSAMIESATGAKT